jgi:hypothetical protein
VIPNAARNLAVVAVKYPFDGMRGEAASMRYERIGWRTRAACLLLACVFSLAACHRTPAEQAIRDTVAAMQKAGEAHDVDGVIAPIADDFVGSGDDVGGEILDRKSFRRYLTLVQMREGGAIHATIGPITIEMQGTNRATATFTAVFTGGAGLLPDDGQIEHVRTGWRLDGSTWELISAEWKEGAGGR